jgi:hypothetical protein
MVVYDAPIDNKNSGITLYTILVDVSVKKLVNPVKKAFFSKPNNFLLSFIECQSQNLIIFAIYLDFGFSHHLFFRVIR